MHIEGCKDAALPVGEQVCGCVPRMHMKATTHHESGSDRAREWVTLERGDTGR